MKLNLKLVILLGIKLDLIYIKIILLRLNQKFENMRNYEIMRTKPSTHNSKANCFFKIKSELRNSLVLKEKPPSRSLLNVFSKAALT